MYSDGIQKETALIHTSETGTPMTAMNLEPNSNDGPPTRGGQTPQNQYFSSKSEYVQVNSVPVLDQSPRTRRSRAMEVMVTWWAELIGCVVMIGMLIAIFATLYPHQRRPLPHWPYRLSINTIIAIFTTVLKAAALFILSEGLSQLKWLWFQTSRSLRDLSRYDAASRGPWGCLRLLVALRGRDVIASIGAVIAILSLAVDPFTQQLVQYYDCPQLVQYIQATIPRANQYRESGQYTSTATVPPSMPMYAYINQGLFSPWALKTPFVCGTGNCSFSGTYSTTGYCATCEDAGDELTVANLTMPAGEFDSIDFTQDGINYTYYLNTSLPSGAFASYRPWSNLDGQRWFTVNRSSETNDYDIIMAAQTLPGTPLSEGEESDTFPRLLGPEGRDDDMVCTTEWQQNTWGCIGKGAARCRLDPCVRTYRANISDGAIEEELVDTHTNMFVGIDPNERRIHVMADATCIKTPEDRQKLNDLGFDIAAESTMIPYNAVVNTSDGSMYSLSACEECVNTTTLPELSGSLLNIIPPECIYVMGTLSYLAIDQYLASLLQGHIYPGTNFQSTFGEPPQIILFNNSYTNTENVNATFQHIAEAITLRVRQAGYGSAEVPVLNQPFRGEVSQNMTCVRVKWRFLTMPAGIVGLATLFLIATLLQTETGSNQRFARGWKSSPLPLVYHGLHGVEKETEGATSEASNIREIKRMADHTNARIR